MKKRWVIKHYTFQKRIYLHNRLTVNGYHVNLVVRLESEPAAANVSVVNCVRNIYIFFGNRGNGVRYLFVVVVYKIDVHILVKRQGNAVVELAQRICSLSFVFPIVPQFVLTHTESAPHS